MCVIENMTVAQSWMHGQQDNIKSLSSHYHRLMIQRIARDTHRAKKFSIAIATVCTVQKFVKPKLKRQLC